MAKPLSVEVTRNLIEDYSDWEIVVNTHDSIIDALKLESRYHISFRVHS